MKKKTIVVRLSVGFTEKQWAAFREALRLRYACGRSEDALAALTARERASLARQAIYAVSKAIVRGGCGYVPLACDLRQETEAETADRIGKRVAPEAMPPDNIIQLEA